MGKEKGAAGNGRHYTMLKNPGRAGTKQRPRSSGPMDPAPKSDHRNSNPPSQLGNDDDDIQEIPVASKINASAPYFPGKITAGSSAPIDGSSAKFRPVTTGNNGISAATTSRLGGLPKATRSDGQVSRAGTKKPVRSHSAIETLGTGGNLVTRVGSIISLTPAGRRLIHSSIIRGSAKPIQIPTTKFVKISDTARRRSATILPAQYARKPAIIRRVALANLTSATAPINLPVQAEQSSKKTAMEEGNLHQNLHHTSPIEIDDFGECYFDEGSGQLRLPPRSPEIIAMDEGDERTVQSTTAEDNGGVTDTVAESNPDTDTLRKRLMEALNKLNVEREKNVAQRKQFASERQYLKETEVFISRLNTALGRLINERQMWNDERGRLQKYVEISHRFLLRQRIVARLQKEAGHMATNSDETPMQLTPAPIHADSFAQLQKIHAIEVAGLRDQLKAAISQLNTMKKSFNANTADGRRPRMLIPYSKADPKTRRRQVENLKEVIEAFVDRLPAGEERDKEIALVLGHVLTRTKPEWVDQTLLRWI